MIKAYLLDIEPRDGSYHALIRVAPRFGSTGLLVVRHWHESDTRRRQELIMGEIADFVTSVEECSEWPGTMLIDHTATVFTFRLAPRVIESLLHKASGLFDWLSPALPEDLCFFRFDGDPWLTTISHERVGALDLTDSELIALREGIPNLVLSPESDETGG